ncbi:MAG: hypothetical protein ACE363_12675 [Alphaproteobacteria bacterium]
MNVKKSDLLFEVEDLLRSMPDWQTLRESSPIANAWIGRALAVISKWKLAEELRAREHLKSAQSPFAATSQAGYSGLLVILHQAQNELRMETVGPTNAAVPEQMIFAYFEALRGVIELANDDVFFIDPYLDADFVARYLPLVGRGVDIRLLSRKRVHALVPAVEAFAKQEGASVEVRATANLHDRYVFIDRMSCYQSGASFKDGAKNAATTITQITDAFGAMLSLYEDLWQSSASHLTVKNGTLVT